MELTVILPINGLKSQEEKTLFSNAIVSVFNSSTKPKELMVVIDECREDLSDIMLETTKLVDASEYKGIKINLLDFKGENHNIQASINFGVKNCTTEYFTILGFDDSLTNYWLSEVEKIKEIKDEQTVFLPLVGDMVDGNNFLRFVNETAWSLGFESHEDGFVNFALLNNPQILPEMFTIYGIVMRKEDFINHGGLKESMKYAYFYEFLLRITNKDLKPYLIPKIGYLHLCNRENSISHMISKMSEDELRWWINTSKKECYHTKDRNKQYVPSVTTTEQPIL